MTLQRLADDLGRLGIAPGDAVLVHSSLSALGWVEGGAVTVVKALLQAVQKEGTVLFPTLTGTAEHRFDHPPTFDVAKTPCWTGAIPEAARTLPGALRSLHPTHSVAAFGPLAAALCYAHEVSQTPCGPETPYLRLARLGGKILFLGCTLDSNTTYHGVEEVVEIPRRYHMQRRWITCRLLTPAGERFVTVKLHYWGVQRNFRALDERLLAEGIMHRGKVGQADCYLVESGPMVELATAALERDPECFLAPSERGKGWGVTRLPEY